MDDLTGKHFTSITDFTTLQIETLMQRAAKLNAHRKGRLNICADKIMVYLFYEPSTRTRMSFQTAMLRLGGQVVGFDNPGVSSVSKGESLADTVRVTQNYGDVIVIRHPQAGVPATAAEYADVPVINAGDGANEHPSQGLAALFTILQKRGSVEGLKVGLCGDLKFGRTVHSFIDVLARFGAEAICIAPPELHLPETYLKTLQYRYDYAPIQVDSLADVMGDLDVLYMTRLQQERFGSLEAFMALQGSYNLSRDLMDHARDDLLIMHPLPRREEIPDFIDDDPRAIYFEQAGYSIPVRMALLASVMGVEI